MQKTAKCLHIHGRLQRAISRFSRAAVSEALLMSRTVGLLRLGPLVNSSQFHDRRVIGCGRRRLTLDPSSEAAADAAEAASAPST
jgi:hypothetical protein